MNNCIDEKYGVTVYCLTYNHEKYIESAIKSFLMQETTFNVQIIIHDDASTDGTTDIVKKYAKLYPEKIYAIIQSENQYSKGIDIYDKFIKNQIRGKYVAICEGDDYWTNKNKLQMQYDALEDNPEIDLCSHGGIKVNVDGETVGTVCPFNRTKIVSAASVIRGGGGFVLTSSLMYRKNIRNTELKFYNFLSFDYTLQILGSLRGGMLFISKFMSAYRVNVPGSWTLRVSRKYENRKIINNKILKMYDLLSEDTDGRYDFAMMFPRLKIYINNNKLLFNVLNFCKKIL